MMHRVNKLQFEAICSTEAEAFEVRQNFSESCQTRISEIIDKVCTAYTSEIDWIHVDNIEVDLGKIDLNSFDNQFADVLLAKFEEEFTNQIKSLHYTEKVSTKELSSFQILKYFLNTGTLPWWTDEDSVDIDSIFLTLIVQEPKIIYQYLDENRYDNSLWERISLQLNEQVHAQICRLFPNLTSAKAKLNSWLHLLDIAAIPDRLLQRFIILHASNFLVDVLDKSTIQVLISRFESEIASYPSFIIPFDEKVERILSYEKQFTFGERNKLLNVEAENQQESIVRVKEEPIPLEKINVKNCGVIILAPYFKSFFTQINLLENGAWKNRDSQIRAIHLIRYLATGYQMCPEHSLVFEKILCGMEINRPIPRDIALNDQEISESAELLNSILSHWSRLKNTSIGGLRETFFKRDGILTQRDNGWILQVERKTVDVLLEDIPWSFSTVMLPWTKYIIYTEW